MCVCVCVCVCVCASERQSWYNIMEPWCDGPAVHGSEAMKEEGLEELPRFMRSVQARRHLEDDDR